MCKTAINTADGSHHYILHMKSHDVFPCSADSLHCSQNVAGDSLYPPSSSNCSSSSSSDKSYINYSSMICSRVCNSHLQNYYYRILVLQITHLLSGDPVIHAYIIYDVEHHLHLCDLKSKEYVGRIFINDKDQM